VTTSSVSTPLQSPELLYLDLMKKVLTRLIFVDSRLYNTPANQRDKAKSHPLYSAAMSVARPGYRWLAGRSGSLASLGARALLPLERSWRKRLPLDVRDRVEGLKWPADAETMIGLRRLDNIQDCITDVLQTNVPGDLIETGVWRGGATIFMRAVLAAYGNQDRVVWVADSFAGLPKPDLQRAPKDRGDIHWAFSKDLAISIEEVQNNFARFSLLDRQVRFLKGWFKDTLPPAPIERLALMRLDGDMYESTMDALTALYPRLSVGGYVIVDDYGFLEPCKAAVDEFREQHSIVDEIIAIDGSGVYWKRSA
jgi:O-methyltransferase